VITVTWSTIRVFLHVLAATVWVGGQLTLGALITAVRPAGPERIRAVARRFEQVAWPAFAVLLATGIWNLFALDAAEQRGPWLVTLLVKLVCVAITGTAAAIHVLVAAPRVRRAADEASRRKAAAFSGACEGISVLFAVAALFLGVLLSG
jgi:putative copper export protein